jgi:hypothetical protein
LSFVSSLFYHAHNFLDFILYSFLSPSKVISSQLNKWGYFIFNIHLFPRIFFIVLLRWRFNAWNCFGEFCQIDWALFDELFMLSWLFYCAIFDEIYMKLFGKLFTSAFAKVRSMNLETLIWSFFRELFLKVGPKTVTFPITTNSSQIFFKSRHFINCYFP